MNNIYSKTFLSTIIVAIGLTAMLVTAPFVGMAFAPKPGGEVGGNAHYVGKITTTSNPDHSITANFKIAGLQAGQFVTATLSASSVSVNGQCVNPGGNSPPPKTFSVGGLSDTDTIGPVPKNGNLQGSVTLGPPSQQQIEAAADCPNPNWDVAVQSVTYSGVTLQVTTAQGQLPVQNLGTITA